ncbi:unnamed protein product [Amoebophrya sp. A120]|nr:unnamed protein product [Amoebophrya sp. A120]|eukprot:GSA120T00002667001.1
MVQSDKLYKEFVAAQDLLIRQNKTSEITDAEVAADEGRFFNVEDYKPVPKEIAKLPVLVYRKTREQDAWECDEHETTGKSRKPEAVPVTHAMAGLKTALFAAERLQIADTLLHNIGNIEIENFLASQTAFFEEVKNMGRTPPPHAICLSAPKASGKTLAILPIAAAFCCTTYNDAEAKDGRQALRPLGAYKNYILGRYGDKRIAPSVLMLAPTRDAVEQNYLAARMFFAKTGILTARAVGGHGRDGAETKTPELASLARGADLLIATTGRAFGLIEAGVLSLHKLQCLVCDDMKGLFEQTAGRESEQKQVRAARWLYENATKSAPRAPALYCTGSNLTRKFVDECCNEFELSKTVLVHAGPIADQPAVNHRVKDAIKPATFIQPDDSAPPDELWKRCQEAKLAALRRELLQFLSPRLPVPAGGASVLVCVNKKDTMEAVFDELKKSKEIKDAFFSIEKYSGGGDGESTAKRRKKVNTVRTEARTLTIASNVCAYGLHLPKLRVVIHFDVPLSIDDYDNRSGRTGRKFEGEAITLVPVCMSSGQIRVNKHQLCTLEQLITRVDSSDAAIHPAIPEAVNRCRADFEKRAAKEDSTSRSRRNVNSGERRYEGSSTSSAAPRSSCLLGDIDNPTSNKRARPAGSSSTAMEIDTQCSVDAPGAISAEVPQHLPTPTSSSSSSTSLMQNTHILPESSSSAAPSNRYQQSGGDKDAAWSGSGGSTWKNSGSWPSTWQSG